MGSSRAISISSGNHDAVSCSWAIKITFRPDDCEIFCRTWCTILNGGSMYRNSMMLHGTDMASVSSALGSGNGDTNFWRRLLAYVANMSILGSPHLENTGRKRSLVRVHSVSVFDPLWTTHPLGHCGCLGDELEPVWSPWGRTTWIDEWSAEWACKTLCLPRSWCKQQSLRCRTSIEPSGVGYEEEMLWRHWGRPASPERLYVTIFEMQVTDPVLSLTRVGLPKPIRTHPCRAWLLSPEWRGVDLVGLLQKPTRLSRTESTEEPWFCRPSPRSSGTRLWLPTNGLAEDEVSRAEPVLP